MYPYRLRRLDIHRPGQVHAMGITYIPMARGFVYKAAVMDGYSRKVWSWRVSITMDLPAYDTVSDARAGIGRYFDVYHRTRPHSSLQRKTPDQVYYSSQPLTLAA